jgi:hypothetical protein
MICRPRLISNNENTISVFAKESKIDKKLILEYIKKGFSFHCG